MSKYNFILIVVVAALLGHLLFENQKIKNELSTVKTEKFWPKRLVVNRETTFLAKENYTYRIKAQLERAGGEVVVIPLFQTFTGIYGDDDGELLTLHLVEHLSEKNEKYYRLSREWPSGASIWTLEWEQLRFPEENNLKYGDEGNILQMLFGPDVWPDKHERTFQWSFNRIVRGERESGNTKARLIIEEIKGRVIDASMGVYL